MRSAFPHRALAGDFALRWLRRAAVILLSIVVILITLWLLLPPIAHAQTAAADLVAEEPAAAEMVAEEPAAAESAGQERSEITLDQALADAEAMPRNTGAAFNVGILYARQDRLGMALLYLERAHLLTPLDREIQDARMVVQREARLRRIDAAGSATVTEGEPAPVVLWRSFAVVPPHTYALTLLVCTWLLFVVLLVRRRLTSGAWRDGAMVVAILALVANLGIGALWLGQAVTSGTLEPAVVVASEPRYRDSPDELSRLRRHGDLYEGAVVLIRERRGDWMMLELVEGDRVWVATGVAEGLE